MGFYRHSTGRLITRGSNGQFRKTTFQDLGINSDLKQRICGKCGYGKDGKWIPLLPNGYCPICKNQEGHIEYKPNC